jgi:hypothetical protein
VIVDVLLYFGRRGRENLHEPKITHFSATTDAEGLVYVYVKNDELARPYKDQSWTSPRSFQFFPFHEGMLVTFSLLS